MKQMACALFAHTRPEKLQALIELIEKTPFSGPTYIFCDGPRHGGEFPQTEAVRKIAKNFARRRRVIVCEREHNIGLSRSIIEGVSEVLSEESSVAIFEDDVHPKEGVVEFFIRALSAYRDVQDIFSLSTYHRRVFGVAEPELFLSPRFNCWGWATWRGRWESVVGDLRSGQIPFPSFSKVPRHAGLDLVERFYAWQKNKTPLIWDCHLALLCLSRSYYQLQTRQTGVYNVGFDGSGNNCVVGGLSSELFDDSPFVVPQEYPLLGVEPTLINKLAQGYSSRRLTRWRVLRRTVQLKMQQFFG